MWLSTSSEKKSMTEVPPFWWYFFSRSASPVSSRAFCALITSGMLTPRHRPGERLPMVGEVYLRNLPLARGDLRLDRAQQVREIPRGVVPLPVQEERRCPVHPALDAAQEVLAHAS